MRALSGPTFDLVLQGSSEDQRAKPTSGDVRRARHKLIVGLYLVSAPVVTIGWLVGLAWAAIKLVGYALS